MYQVNSSDFHCCGGVVMCRYNMRIDGYKNVGAISGCEQTGTILCRFNRETGKLSSVEMVFDVMGFMQQLQVCMLYYLYYYYTTYMLLLQLHILLLYCICYCYITYTLNITYTAYIMRIQYSMLLHVIYTYIN